MPNIITFVGFAAVGVAVGFVYGQGVRQSVPGNVQTRMDGGVVTIDINLGGIALGGLDAFVNG